MSAPTLWPFQTTALDRLQALLDRGCGRILLASPTGSGKTVMAAEVARQRVAAYQRVLFLAPRRELIRQASAKLTAAGVAHGIILAGDKRSNLTAAVQVASVDTLRLRRDRIALPDPHVVIVDECHLYVTKIRVDLLNSWPNALRIGLTATPARKDGRGLGTLFDELLQVETVENLTAGGYLVRGKYFSIAEPDLTRVHLVAGDYQQDELAEAMSPLVADVPTTWLARAAGRRTVVFAVSVAHSVALRAAFEKQGVIAEHVDGGTPTAEREAVFERFRNGTTQVLCNCQLASYGFDLPELDCVVLARPTKSLVFYLQMLGRGLRSAPRKMDCLVLDHSGAVRRFGFATEERNWSLEGHADLSRSRSTEVQFRDRKNMHCPDCRCVFTGTRTCPNCGYYLKPKGKEVRTLAGELVEIGAHLPASELERLAFFLELRGLAQQRGFRSGWAAHKFKEKYGGYPPWPWNDLPMIEPSPETAGWVQSRFIAWRKSQQASA